MVTLAASRAVVAPTKLDAVPLLISTPPIHTLSSVNSGSTGVAAAAAGTAGASPIPGSDAPIIAAIQSTLIYTINSEFELDEDIELKDQELLPETKAILFNLFRASALRSILALSVCSS